MTQPTMAAADLTAQPLTPPPRPPVWQWWAVHFRTGRVVAELPLTNVAGGVRLDGGRFTADLPLQGRPLAVCRDLISATTPGVVSVLGVRDGVIMGEWFLWTRRRTNGREPVGLGGVEVRSWFDHVAVDGWTKRTNIDQLTLAQALAQHALDRAPGVPCTTVDAPGVSGNAIGEADYPTGSDYVGRIISDLAGQVNGFDWWVDTVWDTAAATTKVRRVVRFGYPRRGRPLQAVLDLPRRTQSRSGVALTLDEDATRVATTVYMTGAGEGATQRTSRGRNLDLLQSYPALERVESRSQYTSDALLDAVAAATAAASRTPDVPTSVTVRATGDLQLGTYQPGDTITARMQPSENFPDGLTAPVRVLGYTMRPPADGRTEFVEVEIGRDDDSAFGA